MIGLKYLEWLLTCSSFLHLTSHAFVRQNLFTTRVQSPPTTKTPLFFPTRKPLFMVNEEGQDLDVYDDDDDENNMGINSGESAMPIDDKQLLKFMENKLKSIESESETVDDLEEGGVLESSVSDLVVIGSDADWESDTEELQKRMDQIMLGKSPPSQKLFQLMTVESPNEAIVRFVADADPQVVQAMSGAVSSLLGGLSNPSTGVETIVKASGERIASLCFQLQMTGYMFRNAEYVLALKKLMKLSPSATVKDYYSAFKKLDTNDSGYIEAQEVRNLLDQVYGETGATPSFEIKAFLEFFDTNSDGRISWEEFEKGLSNFSKQELDEQMRQSSFLLSGSDDVEEDDDKEEEETITVSGTIEIELGDGRVMEVEADEYVKSLKAEAEKLKKAIERVDGKDKMMPVDDVEGLASFIAAKKGDMQSLTKGIKPEVVEAMKLLVDFVLDNGNEEDGKKKPEPATAREKYMRKNERMSSEMELPGAALQQLALWQLVLGYRLREAEAKGGYSGVPS